MTDFDYTICKRCAKLVPIPSEFFFFPWAFSSFNLVNLRHGGSEKDKGEDASPKGDVADYAHDFAPAENETHEGGEGEDGKV